MSKSEKLIRKAEEELKFKLIERSNYVAKPEDGAGSRKANVRDIGNRSYSSTTGVSLSHPLELMALIANENQWADLGSRTIAANCAAPTPLFRVTPKLDLSDRRNKRKAQFNQIQEVTNLLNNPNPLQTGYMLQLQTYSNLAIYANAYWQIIRNRKGAIHSIYSLPPEHMRVVPYFDEDGVLRCQYYQLNLVNEDDLKSGKRRWSTYRDDEIIHFKLTNELSYLYGKPSLYSQLYQITTNASAQRAVNTWFDEGLMAGAILRMDAEEQETINRNREFLREMHAGAQNAGKTLLLAGSVDIIDKGNKFGEGIDFGLIMKIGAKDILNCMGVPLSVAGVRSDEGTLNSELVAAEEAAFRRNVVDVYHNVFFGMITKKLIGEFLKMDSIEVKPGTMSKFSLKDSINAVQAMSELGISIREAREQLGMDSSTIPDEVLDMYVVKTNNGIARATDILGYNFNTGEQVETIFEKTQNMKLQAESGGKGGDKVETPVGGQTTIQGPTAGATGLGGDLKDLVEG